MVYTEDFSFFTETSDRNEISLHTFISLHILPGLHIGIVQCSFHYGTIIVPFI